jgi:predicted protein tyrosine phosphatase
MLFKNHQVYNAKSAGTSDKARIKVNQKLIEWADIIFVMEQKHRDLLNQRFSSALSGKQAIILNIEDNYHFGDEELIGILKEVLIDYL